MKMGNVLTGLIAQEVRYSALNYFLNYFKTFSEECGTNENYTKYAAGCERGPNGGPDKTCNDPIGAMKICPNNLAIYSGCFCDLDSVRDSNGKCIKHFDCPNPVCGGENEVFNKCGSNYEATCNPTMTNDTSSKECVPGCFCKPGMVRNVDDECIQLEKCPKPCSDETNEEFLACGSGCGDYTCNQMQGSMFLQKRIRSESSRLLHKARRLPRM